MKKFIYLVLILSIFFYCAPKQEKVERYMEDGVEVVVNQLKPYESESNFNYTLKKRFVIDLENPDTAELGVTNIFSFDLDDEMNIYIFQFPKSGDDIVFKFDGQGRFIKSFGKIGQGPGEIQNLRNAGLTNDNMVTIYDYNQRSLFYFDKNGIFFRQTKLNIVMPPGGLIFLDNGNSIIHKLEVDENLVIGDIVVSIYDAQFEKIKRLTTYNLFNEEINILEEIPVIGASSRFIYIFHKKMGEDIFVYDLFGNPVRRVKKEHKKIPVSKEYEKEIMSFIPKGSPDREKIKFHEFFPAYQNFFTDSQERLYAMTYEKDKSTGAYLCDVFNSQGVFVGFVAAGYIDPIKSLQNDSAKIKVNNRYFYWVREKDNGYKVFESYSIQKK